MCVYVEKLLLHLLRSRVAPSLAQRNGQQHGAGTCVRSHRVSIFNYKYTHTYAQTWVANACARDRAVDETQRAAVAAVAGARFVRTIYTKLPSLGRFAGAAVDNDDDDDDEVGMGRCERMNFQAHCKTRDHTRVRSHRRQCER